MVRHIDAGGIVDGVGIDMPALQRVRDAAALRDAEIGALPDNLGTQLLGVGPERIISSVADLGMRLVMGFDEGADAAEEQKVDVGCQQFADQLGRRQVILGDVEHALHLRRDRHRLGSAVEDAAARRDQLPVVIRPARARQGEQALALGKARAGIGIGVDKDVQVIERGEEARMSRLQHAVAKHVT